MNAIQKSATRGVYPSHMEKDFSNREACEKALRTTSRILQALMPHEGRTSWKQKHVARQLIPSHLHPGDGALLSNIPAHAAQLELV